MREINRLAVVEALNSILTKDDDVVLVHPNIYSFGRMENIVDGLMDTLLEAVGPRRTLLMPTFTFSFCKTGRYHYLESPSETGVLTENFRMLPGVLRTPCPINSFAAMGPEAETFTGFGDSETIWGTDSIYQALYDRNALIIGLGERLALKASIFHHGEQLAGVPYRYFKTFPGRADFGDGEQYVSKKMFVRRSDLPVSYNFSPALERLTGAAQLQEVRLGGSFVEAVHAADALDSLRTVLKEDPLSCLSNREEYQDIYSQKTFAFMGSANLDLLARTFQGEHHRVVGQDCRLVTMPFNQYQQQILNPESDVRVVDPDYVVFAEHAEGILGDLLLDPIDTLHDSESIEDEIGAKLASYLSFIQQARKLLSGRFLVANFETLRPSPLGNADITTDYGNAQVIHIANRLLDNGLANIPDATILDFKALVQRCGTEQAFSKKYWYLGRVPFTNQMASLLSRNILGAMLAAEGRTARLIVLDLDNTLWGGVIGDDGLGGIELGGDYPGNVFKDFQRYLKSLSHRGIALAVCSKNQHDTALRAIEDHPEMVLKSDDFAQMRINWEDKASNIVSICNELGLGTYSTLFIDDNPAERDWVSRNLPDCIVPDLPKDVSQWIEFLADSPYLQSGRLTDADFKRTAQYARGRQLEVLKDSFENVDDFLRDLEMHLYLEPYSEKNQARILQLFAKTNQLNTTTKRYNAQDLELLIQKKGGQIYGMEFQDRFFERETVGVVVVVPKDDEVPALVIDSFVMSCRVMGRNIETTLLAWVCNQAVSQGRQRVEGLFVPTTKNQPVESLYPSHGFKQVSQDTFLLDLSQSHPVQAADYLQIES